jgi:hypothetical protein
MGADGDWAMTPAELLAEIARCDREIAAMECRPPDLDAPAYLTTMGIEDWRAERRILERQLAGM